MLLSGEAAAPSVGPTAGLVPRLLEVVCVSPAGIVCSVVESDDAVCVVSGGVVASGSAKHNKTPSQCIRRFMCEKYEVYIE